MVMLPLLRHQKRLVSPALEILVHSISSFCLSGSGCRFVVVLFIEIGGWEQMVLMGDFNGSTRFVGR